MCGDESCTVSHSLSCLDYSITRALGKLSSSEHALSLPSVENSRSSSETRNQFSCIYVRQVTAFS
jgi:hypothetical protein